MIERIIAGYFFKKPGARKIMEELSQIISIFSTNYH